MKKIMNYAALVVMTICCACMVSCGESYDSERIVPSPAPSNDTTTKPDPTPSDLVDNTWKWSAIVDQTVNFDELTEIVEANNIAQLSKQSGETKLDSAQLRYQFGVELTAPTRVVTMSPDTTVYSGKGLPKSEYGAFKRHDNDSLRTVTTVVEGGFRTSYYSLGLTTSRKEGFSIHAGKWIAYKNVTESSLLTSIWHEDLYEVELNDSIFNREKSHAVITITLKGNGRTWTIQREKVIVVDHFIGVKEEKKDDKVNADVWVTGLGRMVSLTRGIYSDYKIQNPKPEDRRPFNAALFEGEDGYTAVVDIYDNKNKYITTEVCFHRFDVCPKSNDYDGVGYIQGSFYPGKLTYHYESASKGGYHDWEVVCFINKEVKNHYIIGQEAVNAGIKNFIEDKSAYPSPYLTNASTSEKVNGKMVWHVKGAQSTGDPIKEHTVADSSLK